MKPYYSDETVTIYHGDCAEIAPTLGKFDLLCTDPPYGIREARKDHSARGRRKYKSHGFVINAAVHVYELSEWDDRPVDDTLLALVMGAARWRCVFGGNYFALPPSRCWLVWDKQNGASDFADAELAWTNYESAVRLKRYQWNGMLRGGLSGQSAEKRYHPTQKPLAIMSWAIGLCPDRPTSVLDPFMGSGTTLRACKDLGIRVVGIEREEKYCAIAADRMRQGVLL